ncbi:hypothetical protein [Bacillus mycoides]|uniref:Uncharacterized protein n=1 Tax=Bacillus mycoides TaxID=1405 RepID=A0A4U2ZY18_BACMY|nr:hypothetical protein [Bacillus mycoides]TKI79828.1 hypothetical protein FC701_30505 [Bacillus mycoides]
MKFFKRFYNDDFYGLIESSPELSKALEILSEEEMFELGYSVLEDAILVLGHISQDLDSGINQSFRRELCFWIQVISKEIHNIPEKLHLRDITFLREEIYNAISVLYSVKQRKFEGIKISTNRIELCLKSVCNTI